MKKVISLVVSLAILGSLTVTALAADKSTTVTYTGTGKEEYEITVPATLTPGQSGNISATGTWSSSRRLNVTAPSSVTLTNSIDNSTKTLAITFDGISKVGNNTSSITDTKSIAVADITNALFGTWTGSIKYNVSIIDEVKGS